MKVTVLSGSPKGEYSVSLQYFRFIAKHTETLDFNIFHVGEQINKIKNSESELLKIIDSVKESDCIIWVFPVYHFLVPAQLKEFIEILNRKNYSDCFKNKYSTSIITSIHFYDTLAENYIHAVSEDFGMNYINGFLAEMTDLKKVEKQAELLDFGRRFFQSIKNNKIVPKIYNSIKKEVIPYTPILSTSTSKSKDNNYKILLITDNSANNENLKNMITVFANNLKNRVELINLDELTTKGGCLGCCSCGYDNTCVYNDEMNNFLHNSFLNSDAIVIASEIKDRYLSWQIKRFWDRSFTHGHKPILENKKLLYIISGSLSENSVLKSEIEARSGVSKAPVIDIVCDEFISSDALTKHLIQAGNDLIESIAENRKSQENFHFLAGHKIFRDFVYLIKFVFRADHKFYKKNNYYDFPQKKISLRVVNRILMLILKFKPFRVEFQKRTKPSMVAELKRIAD